jgi:hypothetical protein
MTAREVASTTTLAIVRHSAHGIGAFAGGGEIINLGRLPIDADGNLYGTASNIGQYGDVVFEVTP